jgi:hypothetical protein
MFVLLFLISTFATADSLVNAAETDQPESSVLIANVAYLWFRKDRSEVNLEMKDLIDHIDLFIDCFPIPRNRLFELLMTPPPLIEIKLLNEEDKINSIFEVMIGIYLNLGIFQEPPPIVFKPVYLTVDFMETFMVRLKPLSNKTETGSRASSSAHTIQIALRDTENELAKILLGKESSTARNIAKVNGFLESFERIISGFKVSENFPRYFNSFTPIMKAERIDRLFLYVWEIYLSVHRNNLDFLNDRIDILPESQISMYDFNLGNIWKTLQDINLQLPPIIKYKISLILQTIGPNINTMAIFFTEDESRSVAEVPRVLETINHDPFTSLYGWRDLQKDQLEKQILMMKCLTDRFTLNFLKKSSIKTSLEPFIELVPDLEALVSERCGFYRDQIAEFYPKIEAVIFTRPAIESDSMEVLNRKAKKLLKWWKPIYELSEPGSTLVMDLWKNIMEELKKKRK